MYVCLCMCDYQFSTRRNLWKYNRLLVVEGTIEIFILRFIKFILAEDPYLKLNLTDKYIKWCHLGWLKRKVSSGFLVFLSTYYPTLHQVILKACPWNCTSSRKDIVGSINLGAASSFYERRSWNSKQRRPLPKSLHTVSCDSHTGFQVQFTCIGMTSSFN